MIFSNFQNEKISLLGFGAMRLPTVDGKIDDEKVSEMVDEAIKSGVNYFDTAYPYHGGESEISLSKALAKYPRSSYFLADKYPGHQIADHYDPAEIFEDQLKKCRTEYFDFYLLHNVCETSMGVYTDPKWGILSYFLEQKKKGRIRHLGFSSHARPENLEKFLGFCGRDMEFCQIQLNYLDYSLQNAREKLAILRKYGIPVWVMEPLRGGRLARLTDKERELLPKTEPERSPVTWAFSWLGQFPEVKVILSGMSDPDQLKENIAIFSEKSCVSEAENAALFDLAKELANAIPCTACRYCCAGCPQELDIPLLLHTYNDVRFGLEGALTAAMQIQALPPDKRPDQCIGCGACRGICPQGIDVPELLGEFARVSDKLPDWEKISKERNEQARVARMQRNPDSGK